MKRDFNSRQWNEPISAEICVSSFSFLVFSVWFLVFDYAYLKQVLNKEWEACTRDCCLTFTFLFSSCYNCCRRKENISLAVLLSPRVHRSAGSYRCAPSVLMCHTMNVWGMKHNITAGFLPLHSGLVLHTAHKCFKFYLVNKNNVQWDSMLQNHMLIKDEHCSYN